MFGKKYTTVVEIDGMKCANCAKHMRDAFMELEGVKKVEIDLEKRCATITSKSELSEESLKEKVNQAGYSFLSKKSV